LSSASPQTILRVYVLPDVVIDSYWSQLESRRCLFSDLCISAELIYTLRFDISQS